MTNKSASRIWLLNIYYQRSEIERMLLLSCLFSTSMTLLRAFATGQPLFLWLNWNLFLAFLPYAVTRWLSGAPAWVANRPKFVAVFTGWLLLFPNAFYIITDLFHLRARLPVPLWFDLLLILSFVWNGLLFGILSLCQMEKLIEERFSLKKEWLFLYPVMLLTAFGIFVGRYWRYNSWDVLSNPFELVQDSVYLLVHPLRHFYSWGMIFGYALFMTLLYNTLKKICHSLK